MDLPEYFSCLRQAQAVLENIALNNHFSKRVFSLSMVRKEGSFLSHGLLSVIK